MEQVVERMGQMFDAKRFSRTTGRIFGLLIFADHPLSIDKIVEALSVSRASVSTETRRLEERGMLERVSRPGDRRDYYQVSLPHLRHMAQNELARMNEMRQLLFSTLEVPGLAPSVRARVNRFCEFNRQVQIQMSALIESLEKKDSPTPVAPEKVV